MRAVSADCGDGFPGRRIMILVIDVELPEYRVPVYRRLQERLGEEVFVYHGRPRVASGLRLVRPDEDVGFPHAPVATRWLLGGRVLVRDLRLPLRHRPAPRVVIMRPLLRDIGLFPAVWRFKQRGIPVIGWGHGYSRRRGFRPHRRLSDRGYLAIVESFDAYIFYTDEIRGQFGRFVDPERLFVAQNTQDTGVLIEMRRRLEAEGRGAVRASLGLDRQAYLGFIGRLQSRKGVDVLLKAFASLKLRSDMDLGLLIIGDGAHRAELEAEADRLELSDVHFLGALYGESASRYLFSSDVMAMPGALGLAVPHAFALGVPVVSRRLGEGLLGHGPEAAYVEPGVTGQFAPAEGGTPSFVSALLDVLENRAAYSKAAVAFAEEHLTLDSMVEGFTAAVQYVSG